MQNDIAITTPKKLPYSIRKGPTWNFMFFEVYNNNAAGKYPTYDTRVNKGNFCVTSFGEYALDISPTATGYIKNGKPSKNDPIRGNKNDVFTM